MRMTEALIDRLTHRADIHVMNGESYRFRQSIQAWQKQVDQTHNDIDHRQSEADQLLLQQRWSTFVLTKLIDDLPAPFTLS